ncbi:FAD binding domain-containing protein [Pseudotabrizicola sp. L79]|uniref:FAD binding domain-containing protein n=1 Tax=Pseudotabrizicola sp. L79 TaxID=3118402 RepID=UPI002F92FF5A
MNAYARPQTLEEAAVILRGGPRTVLAGGTDLYPQAGQTLGGAVLDLTAIPDLMGFDDSDGLRIGACTTWTQIAEANLPPSCHALQHAARQVGGRQIQNVGTIGGNLCNASPAADGVPPLLVLDADVELLGPSGRRSLPLGEFLQGPRQTARQENEIMTAIILPAASLSGQSGFVKLGARAYLVISIAMVAARITVAEGKIIAAAVAVGACSGTARRLGALEAKLIGQTVGSAISAISETEIAAALAPISDVRATADYRMAAACDLIRTAVAKALA